MFENEEDEVQEGDSEGPSSFMFTTGKLQLKSVNHEKTSSPDSAPDADSIGAEGEGEENSKITKLFEGSHARENFNASEGSHPVAEDDEHDAVEVKISFDAAKEDDDQVEKDNTEYIEVDLGDDRPKDDENERSVDADENDAPNTPEPKINQTRERPLKKELPNRYNKSGKVGSGAFRDLLIYAIGASDQFAKKTKGFTQVKDMIQRRELINESWSYQARLKKHHQMAPGQPLPPVLQLPRLAKPIDPSNSATNSNRINDHGPPACASER